MHFVCKPYSEKRAALVSHNPITDNRVWKMPGLQTSGMKLEVTIHTVLTSCSLRNLTPAGREGDGGAALYIGRRKDSKVIKMDLSPHSAT